MLNILAFVLGGIAIVTTLLSLSRSEACRELWIQSLGMPSVLPPPEEEKDVKTAIGAARAEKAREEML